MKIFKYLVLFFVQSSFAQTLAPIPSKVYPWAELKPIERPGKGFSRSILEGSTPHFKLLKVHATTLNPKSRMRDKEYSQENEELIIVKSGIITVTIEGKSKDLKTGGIALILSGDTRSVVNNTDAEATYYVIQFNSLQGVDIERGKKAGGSILLNMDETSYIAHDKGGRRNYINGPTSMCKRLEMHTTTLTGQWASHAPHTHEPAEILLLFNSNGKETYSKTQETISGQWHDSVVGDLIFLNSNVEHGLKNIGEGSCTYFAFQFE